MSHCFDRAKPHECCFSFHLNVSFIWLLVFLFCFAVLSSLVSLLLHRTEWFNLWSFIFFLLFLLFGCRCCFHLCCCCRCYANHTNWQAKRETSRVRFWFWTTHVIPPVYDDVKLFQLDGIKSVSCYAIGLFILLLLLLPFFCTDESALNAVLSMIS